MPKRIHFLKPRYDCTGERLLPLFQVRCRDALLTAKLMMVKGIVETDNNVIHVIDGELIDCSHYLNDMVLRSRDFH